MEFHTCTRRPHVGNFFIKFSRRLSQNEEDTQTTYKPIAWKDYPGVLKGNVGISFRTEIPHYSISQVETSFWTWPLRSFALCQAVNLDILVSQSWNFSVRVSACGDFRSLFVYDEDEDRGRASLPEISIVTNYLPWRTVLLLLPCYVEITSTPTVDPQVCRYLCEYGPFVDS